MSTLDRILPVVVVLIFIVAPIFAWRTAPLRELSRFYSAPRQQGFPSISNCWIDMQRLAIGEKWRPVFMRRSGLLNMPTISVTPAGLQITWAFHVLFIPWEEVDIQATRNRYEIVGSTLLRFQKTRLIALRVSEAVLKKMLDFRAPFQFDDQGRLVRTK